MCSGVSPPLDLEDAVVVEEIQAMRVDLEQVLRVPKRWHGGLRRTSLARAIRGSNSIEGYDVEVDDAAAALDDEEPLSADQQTFAEIRGYRQALGFVLAMADDATSPVDESTIRSMHFMMLGHDLSAAPGRYRPGAIFVPDKVSGTNVYQGPDPELVPGLMRELATWVAATDAGLHPLVRGAMAHLNLVMIHPFRDGNGG